MYNNIYGLLGQPKHAKELGTPIYCGIDGGGCTKEFAFGEEVRYHFERPDFVFVADGCVGWSLKENR